MKLLILIIFCLSIIILCCNKSFNNLTIELINWINQNSHFDYNIHNGLPSIEFIDEERTKNIYGDYWEYIEAFYDKDNKKILIRDNIDLSSIYGKSVLLHELVHFIQYQNGIDKKVECRSMLERDAYDIQREYLDNYNIPKPFDEFTILMRSKCMYY